MRTQRFRDDLRFHQRMKSDTSSAGFTGNKYARQKVRSVVAGVGLRKSATDHCMPAARAALPAGACGVRLAPGEGMPDEFPSSDGPDIQHGCTYTRDTANCFLS